MSLAAGFRLGVYEIVSLLGAGGMGEVYRARDTRLDRTVAIKVMPPTLAADPQFRARFDREARAISQLTHPHICTLHDVGEVDGTAFLVMELLQGQTLAERLKKGPLPVDEALKISTDVADALSTAHKQGIVHRDLKPANIMLTKTGAKLLDFGLAKAATPAVRIGATSDTASTHLTGSGTILGTLQYMAPEQVEGREADARTDVWALGAVLYEMVTGRQPFNGDSSAAIVGAILKDRPLPVSTQRSGVSSVLDHIIDRCLARDADERWQSVADAAELMRWTLNGVAFAHAGPGGRRLRGYVAAALLVAVAATAAIALATARASPPLRGGAAAAITRSVVDAPDFTLSGARIANLLALSPDGMRLVYVATLNGTRTQLYLRKLDQFEATPLAGTEDGTQPFFSPDGRSIGFFSHGKLKTVGLDGTSSITLGDAPSPFGGAWTRDDVIVFAPDSTGLFKVPARGGPVQRLTQVPPTGVTRHSWPTPTADGAAVLYTVSVTSVDAHIDAVALSDGSIRTVVRSGASPAIVDTGLLVFTDALTGALSAVRFDEARRTTTGAPTVVLEGVMALPQGSQFALSRSGTLVYVPNASLSDRSLVWVDRTGRISNAMADRMAFGTPRLAPDGRRIAFLRYDGLNPREILVHDPATALTTSVASEGRANTVPEWSPNGNSVVVSSLREASLGQQNLFIVSADGRGVAEQITRSPNVQVPFAWSRDGTVVFGEIRRGTQYDILAVSLKDHAVTTVVATPGNDIGASLSRDGKYVAYSSDESGRPEIYVQTFPAGGSRTRVSVDGGTEPTWSNAGELFYRNGDRMMAIETKSSLRGLEFSSPRVLFEGRFERTILTPGLRMYDAAPDGRRFLMVKSSDDTDPRRLRLITNWVTDVQRALAGPG